MNYVTTISGRHVDFLDPKLNSIRIYDIIWGLSRQCRYNNQLELFYSNAEHSVLVSRHFQDFELRRQCLIHDFAEYIFGDLPSPVKHYCPIYCVLIGRFEDFLNQHFLGYSKLDRSVTLADRPTSVMCSIKSQSQKSTFAA